jgi:S-DNA-T family DNA segregation ATPase FtsK/SpoIIIE
LVLGVVDRPRDQSQDPWSFDLDRDGSLLVFGAGGTGKTVLLRTVAAALARSASPDQMHIYGLDFASRGLRMLLPLPQVGDVLTAEDTEQVMRLFRTLRQRISLRRSLLADAGATDLTEYRRLSPGGLEQERLVVLLDGYAGFTATYEKIQGGELLDTMPRLVADGRSVGVHFVITGDRRNAVPSALLGVVTRRVVLRLSSRDEYANLGLDTRRVDLEAPPGRGLVDGLELQIAMLGSDPTGDAQQRGLADLGRDQAGRHGTRRAPAIGLLPEHVAIDELGTSSRPLTAIFGIGDDDLAPTGLDLSDTNAVIAGPNRSGRTTALAAIAVSLARSARPPELHLLSARRRDLVDVATWGSVSIGDTECANRLGELLERFEAGTPPDGAVVIVDDLSDLVEGEADRPLTALVKLSRDQPVRIVAAGESAALRRSSFNAAGELRKDKTGLLLQPDLELDGDILGTRLPRRSVLRFPPGRGFVVRRGIHELFHVAIPASGAAEGPGVDAPTGPPTRR